MFETMITVVGNVVDVPECRTTDTGHEVASFRVASTARRYDKGAAEWTDGESLFLKVTCWRQLAVNVRQSVRRGDPVVATGRVYTRNAEVEGKVRTYYQMDATALGHDLSRGVAVFRRNRVTPPTYEETDEAAQPTDADGFGGSAMTEAEGEVYALA